MKPYNYKSLKEYVYDQMILFYQHRIGSLPRESLVSKGWLEVYDIDLAPWLKSNGHLPYNRQHLEHHNLVAKILKMLEGDGLVLKKSASFNEIHGTLYTSKKDSLPNKFIYKIATPTEIVERKVND